MPKPYDADETNVPECRATLALIQRVLDGEVPAESLDADPHPGACPSCRDRAAAARVLLAVLAAPREPVIPGGFADRVLGAVNADRRRRRLRSLATTVAVAAALLLAVWFFTGQSNTGNSANPNPNPNPGPGLVQQKSELAPAPRPIRIGDEFAKASGRLLETPKPLTESVAVAPKLFDVLTVPFTQPAAAPDPMATALEPARKSITELPSVARSGLEPVTDTAEKAYNRLLRDLGAVKPKS